MQLLFLQEWSRALGWTLLHSLWQGVLAAAIAGIVILATRRSAARLRYNLLGSVLIVFILSSLVTFILYAQSSAITVTATSNEVAPLPSIDYTTAVDLTITNSPTIASEFTNYFNNNASPFVITWAIFFIFHGIKLLTGLASIQRMRVYKRHEVAETWKLKLQELSDRLGIRQSVRLFQSELVKVPVAIGYLKPVILVPLGLLSHLPPDQAETILLHELAHIRRHDYVINLMQRIAEAVFFFNPALLWISSLIRQEREACCDDIVVANTQSKGTYLEALVSFQEYSLTGTGYAMAIGHNRHYLLNRVKRIMTRENKKLNLMEKIILILSLVTITAFTLLPAKEVMAKKETITNSNLGANREIGQELEKPVAIQPPPRRSANKRKPVVAKEPVAVYVDTLPKKINYSELVFKDVSSNSNNDETNRTKTVIATDQYGKKYMLNKLNDKVTSLSIDGNTIPEADLKNYAELIDVLDYSHGNNGERKKAMAERSAKLKADGEERMSKRRKQADEDRAERMEDRAKKMKEVNERIHEIDRKRKEIDERKNEQMIDRRMEYEKDRKKFGGDSKEMKKRQEEITKLQKERDKERKEQTEKFKKEREKSEQEYMERKKELEEKYEKLEEKKKDMEKEKKDKKEGKDFSYLEMKSFDYVSAKKIELGKSWQTNQQFKLEGGKKFELINNKKPAPMPAFKRAGLFSTPPSNLFKPMKPEPKAPSIRKKINIAASKMEVPTVG